MIQNSTLPAKGLPKSKRVYNIFGRNIQAQAVTGQNRKEFYFWEGTIKNKPPTWFGKMWHSFEFSLYNHGSARPMHPIYHAAQPYHSTWKNLYGYPWPQI